MANIKFVDEYGCLQYMGPHPMEKTKSEYGKKLTRNDIRRNKRLSRWKISEVRYASGVTSSKFVYFAEFTFVNSAGHQKVVTETTYEKI